MNPLIFSAAMDLLDDRYLSEAETYHHQKKVTVRRFLSTAACLLFSIVLAGYVILATCPAVKAAISDWFRDFGSYIVKYHFQGEKTDCEDTKFDLGYVPDGYVLIDEMANPESTIYIFANSENLFFSFHYIKSAENNTLSIYAEWAEHKQVIVNGNLVDLHIGKNTWDGNALVWFDKTYGILFQISGYLDESTLIQIAESVRPVKNNIYFSGE